MSPARYVRLPKFYELTGITVKAAERKIETRAWREGHEYKKGPDGKIYVDMEGFARWVEGRSVAA